MAGLPNQALVLLSLARDNKADDIKRVVAGGIPVNAANEFGQTALHVAALWGNVDAIRALLEAGADHGCTNSRGSTPLHFAAAAKKNALQACRVLLDAGADAKAADMSGREPYEMADAEDVRQLLGGPDPRIFELAAKGDAAGLKKLLEEAEAAGEPISLRVVDGEGATPLNLAIEAQSLEAVKVILAADSGLHSYMDMSGTSPLHAAVEAGDTNVLAFLLQAGADVNAKNLHDSEYAQGNWLSGGEALEPFHQTPLHMAVEAGDAAAVRLLLDTGRCDVNALDFSHATPLHTALESRDEELVGLLLAAGADANLPNPDFRSPLHLAASRGPASLLRLLLEAGKADPRVAAADGWTPLQLAARGGSAERVGLLLEAGAEPGAANQQGSTPLHLAAVNGHGEVVKQLLAAGAPKDAQNKEGKTAADLAKTEEVRALLA